MVLRHWKNLLRLISWPPGQINWTSRNGHFPIEFEPDSLENETKLVLPSNLPVFFPQDIARLFLPAFGTRYYDEFTMDHSEESSKTAIDKISGMVPADYNMDERNVRRQITKSFKLAEIS